MPPESFVKKVYMYSRLTVTRHLTWGRGEERKTQAPKRNDRGIQDEGEFS